jgi:hypothetical protein
VPRGHRAHAVYANRGADVPQVQLMRRPAFIFG